MLREMRKAFDTLNLEAPLPFVFEDLQWWIARCRPLLPASGRQRRLR